MARSRNHFFFDAVEAAEFECCAAACFFGADSCGYMVGDLTIEMEAQFLVELFFCARFLKKAANPAYG